jgi:hypothetical protein
VSGAGEIVVYLPNGGGRATADIVPGSAIVGRPDAGSDQVTIYFEGAIYDHENVRTLADRANQAAGRMLQRYPTTEMRAVPRDVLMAVGTFDPQRRQIFLTGPHSEGAVAEWLGMVQLDPTELRTSREAGGFHVPSSGIAAVDSGLLHALMQRGGIRAEGHEWVTGDGRRSAAVGEALLWALESIAQEKG